MPPAIIPNKLSFIWLGSALPGRYARNLLMWAMLNPEYEVHLWGEQFLLLQHVRQIFHTFQAMTFEQEYGELSLVDTFNGQMVVIQRAHDVPLQVMISPIESIPMLVDPSLLYEELTVWKNYGTSSDILRLSVLNAIGGIYMDTDTYPRDWPLPLSIHAPRGILFCSMESFGNKVLLNPIIASPAQNHQLSLMAVAFEQSYAQELPSVTTGVREVTDGSRARFNAVSRARVQLEELMDDEISKFSGAGRVLHEQFVVPAVARPQSALKAIEDKKLSRDVVQEYSFQDQSGYFPILKSEATWQTIG